MDNPNSYFDDEIDLREFVLVLLKRWKLILLLILLGGGAGFGFSMLQHPVYEASAQILIPPSVSPANAQVLISTSIKLDTTSPSVYLLSDAVRQKAADSLGMEPSEISSVAVVADKTNTALFTITAQAASAQRAAQIANAWSEAGIAYVAEISQLPLTQEAQARSALTAADRALVYYQQQNGLDQLTWVDLQVLTGVGQAAPVFGPSLQEIPPVTFSQRLEIAKLMQARLDAQMEYDTFHTQMIQAKYNLAANPPMVIMYASVPKVLVRPRQAVNTLLGAVAGALLAMSWIVLRGWLQQSTENSKNRPS